MPNLTIRFDSYKQIICLTTHLAENRSQKSRASKACIMREI